MDPTDPASFNHRTERLSTGRTYHFVDHKPESASSAATAPTILCVHGFPDIWCVAIPSPSSEISDTHCDDDPVQVWLAIPDRAVGARWIPCRRAGHARIRRDRQAVGRWGVLDPKALRGPRCASG